ncbi:glutaminase liver isoform, mitochondrial-like isoform X3 [Amphibalanus amphitrite]|uniref:glutaminase liver isoform, mitochondrial-like isoform X3 n=1 Tax=Amphibalanus amphitrite TaxID=1232801 RepID=UPI001C8FE515|nr:glutaminase liver isoform, mitochondrial-like isoform X3 [Amphibalanus amphitrite]XP_043244021.1 glutaminase liver isoform, mitochondrial-like isoform X3 [Amphibalanus amphitrite]
MVQPRDAEVGEPCLSRALSNGDTNGSQEQDEREPSPVPPEGEGGPRMGRRPSNSRMQLRWQLSRQESLSWSSLFLESSSRKTSTVERKTTPPVRMNIDMESKLQRIKQKGQNRHTLSHVEDKLCEMYRASDDSGRVNVTKFLEALAAVGLRQTDPRLTEMKRSILSVQSSCARDSRFWSNNGLCFDEDIFKGMIMDNIDIVNKALTGEMVIPQFETFCAHIEEIYETCQEFQDGKAACYIPQLDRVDAELWGVSLCTIDGQRYSVGDVEVPFTIQSVSKPIGYAIACADNGPDFVHKYVGQEPSGRSFNELCLDNNNKPHNPMINSGAIMVSTLLRPELDIADRFDYIFKKYKKMTGGEYLGFNNAIFLSERQAADRNFALAYFMREYGCFANQNIDLVSTLDFYFQMCSLEVTCESAAVIAGTLANGGVCPITGEAVLDPEAVRNTLCLMHSCGMYDYSGQFAFKCGVPAKSGVSGIIIVVIPNVVGFALYSPRLDAMGNSVRGVKFCKELIQKFNFHHFDNMSASTPKLDPRRTCAEKRADILYRVLFAAAAGDLTAIRRYCMMEVNLNDGDYDGRTALHLASAEGHLKVVKFLVEKCNVLVDPKDRWGNVPLDDARMGGNSEIVSFLIRKYKECRNMPSEDDPSNGLDFEPEPSLSRRSMRQQQGGTTDSDQELDVLRATETKLNNLALFEAARTNGTTNGTASAVPRLALNGEMNGETMTRSRTATPERRLEIKTETVERQPDPKQPESDLEIQRKPEPHPEPETEMRNGLGDLDMDPETPEEKLEHAPQLIFEPRTDEKSLKRAQSVQSSRAPKLVTVRTVSIGQRMHRSQSHVQSSSDHELKTRE